MRISTKGRYALRMMTDIAVHDDGVGYISLRDVAERQGISMKYLEQIVSLLCKSGLLCSVRGPQGGYRLTRAACEYTAGDILRVTEGELALVTCLEEKGEACPRQEYCPATGFWQTLQDHINQYVDGVTLEQLAAIEKAKQDERMLRRC